MSRFALAPKGQRSTNLRGRGRLVQYITPEGQHQREERVGNAKTLLPQRGNDIKGAYIARRVVVSSSTFRCSMRYAHINICPKCHYISIYAQRGPKGGPKVGAKHQSKGAYIDMLKKKEKAFRPIKCILLSARRAYIADPGEMTKKKLIED